MCEAVITQENFNPKIFYICKKKIIDNFEYHCHDFIELRYILSGFGRYLIDGTVYSVKSGDIIICNPNVKHKNIFNCYNESTVEFHAGFTDIHIRNFPKDTLYTLNNSPILYMPSNHRQEFVKCCYEILAEQQNGKAYNDLMIKSLFMKLLVLIIRELYPQPEVLYETENAKQLGCNFESSNKNYIINTIISYLNENYERKISLNKISQNMYLSPVYISKLFKEETGESPINYLIQIRLEKAKEYLMKDKNASIKDVAKSVGYDDAYYFSKLFKKYYGVSPSYYTNDKSKV